MDAEQRIEDLGLELPLPPTALASYIPVVVSGNLAFVSGQVPLLDGRPMWSGKLGAELDVEAGASAARRCALQILSALRAELGSLDRVVRVVKLTVWVASADGFTDQPKVANGASDLLAEVFGDAGRHARAAVAAPELPLGAPVEIEAIVAVEPRSTP
jgi:enamine deaminase RidA (YjgF/YER057c/UK114 family)